uniref:Thyroid adenoma-associated protein homolog n=1 Tax=Saccoglossus kowalevskii TaxID=10224 RepID=A0ABM0LWS3_SACKO|nr:PREDICTED: thyroid adenoma-associated protein homolog [Saccoglossus kowalevskii]
MGMAIDEAIVESKDGGNDHEESAVISVEHQLILAYSWLNIKECSLLLGAIAEKLPLCDEFSGVLSTEQIQKMADMFVKVLTKCRHRGAIEGCNLGFMKLCSRLLSSSSQELSSIPKTLLDQVFCLLDSSLSGTSITRRSAGLPLMVETITACEPKGRERSLLKLSMTRLLQTVNHPIPTDTTQTIDLPQVHALNIMKSLFRNSVLGNTMLQYASDVVMVTIEGFSSSSWAIRNSATLLYGTLVARMLGQKRVQDEHSDLNTITAQEFFYRYPKLQSYLLSEVIKASTSNNRLNLHPGLHPVLTLLSKLAVGIQQYSSECALSSFIQPVMELSSSPIYAVRVLSASALVPLVTMEEQPNILSAILDDLPASFDAVKYHNKLHGMLLQIEKLLQSLTSHERFMSSYSSVIGKLQAKLWLAKSDNPCPLTRALYVNILLKCLTNMEDESEKYQQLKLHVFKIVTDFRNENVENLVCGSILSKAMVEASWVFQQEENISQFLHQCLLSSDTEIQLSSLHHINHVINSQPIITGSGSDTLLTLIIKDLKHESSQSCLLVKLQIFILLMQHDNLSISDDFHHLWQILLPLARGVKGSTMAATAVPALAVILKRNLDCEKSRHYISDWCSLIQEYSSATNVEDLRLAVTKSLQIVGCDVLQAIANSQDEQLVQYAINIFQCSMCLLQDEVYEIRMEGAQFTSLLPRTASCIQYSSLHSNVGLQLLFVYMFHTYQWSCVFVMYILDYMQGKVSVVDVIEKHIKAR